MLGGDIRLSCSQFTISNADLSKSTKRNICNSRVEQLLENYDRGEPDASGKLGKVFRATLKTSWDFLANGDDPFHVRSIQKVQGESMREPSDSISPLTKDFLVQLLRDERLTTSAMKTNKKSIRTFMSVQKTICPTVSSYRRRWVSICWVQTAYGHIRKT